MPVQRRMERDKCPMKRKLDRASDICDQLASCPSSDPHECVQVLNLKLVADPERQQIQTQGPNCAEGFELKGRKVHAFPKILVMVWVTQIICKRL